MRIITDTDRTEALEPCVATIGCFDGVHRGHRYLINQVCEVAAEKGLHAAIVTFPVHPRQVMQTDYQPQLLSCLHQKTDLISQLDADYCFMLPFTRELSQLSAREFMQVLQKHYHIQARYLSSVMTTALDTTAQKVLKTIAGTDRNSAWKSSAPKHW